MTRKEMMELRSQWKVLGEYPKYEINRLGSVRKIETRKNLKVYKDKKGRNMVIIPNANKYHYSLALYASDLCISTFGEYLGDDCIEADVNIDEVVSSRLRSNESSIDSVNSGSNSSSNTEHEGPKLLARRRRRVKCVETGKIFKSFTECAKELGFKYDKFYYQINYTTNNKYEGFTFEIVE